MKIFSGTGVGTKKSSGNLHFYKENSEPHIIQNQFTTC